MIWHPLLLTTVAVQALGLLLLSASALTAFRVVAGWKPASADRHQLTLEIKTETAVLQTHWSLGLYIFSELLLIVGISNVYPDVIPGAMCGTGVIQTMKQAGSGSLILNGILLAVLLYWHGFETLNRRQPDGPLTVLCARLTLLALPVAILAFGWTVLAALEVDVHLPVDCCAVVYDQFRTYAEARQISGLPDRYWLGAWAALSLLLFVSATGSRRAGSGSALKWNALLALVSVLWVPLATVTLVNILSAYHYGVLQHQCPWCLFLWQHGAVGFALFGAIGVIAFESIGAFLLPAATMTTPAIFPSALERSRTAARRVLLALAVYLTASVLPPVIWQLRFGVWLNG